MAHAGHLSRTQPIVVLQVSSSGGGLFSEASHDSNRSLGRFVLWATSLDSNLARA
jgi:hypothetical protein